MRKADTLYAVKLFGLTIILMIYACSTTNKPLKPESYHQLASLAEDNRNYKQAKVYYQKALKHARKTNPQSSEVSATMYNLGRINGYLCKFQKAQQLLQDALTLENKLSGSDSQTSSMNTLELARLYFDQHKHIQALPYYRHGIIILEKLSAQKSDPIAFANTLDEYAVALNSSNAHSEAKAARFRANKLRKQYPNQTALFKPLRYGTNCRH